MRCELVSLNDRDPVEVAAELRRLVPAPEEVSAPVAEILGRVRIATKYPRVAAAHFAETGRQAEIVEVKGSVEIAPLTGLADGIVDLVASGRTLAENRLVERVHIALAGEERA